MPLNRLVNANYAPRCQHTKTSGLPCGSPARRGRRFCCFHDSAARRNRDFVLPLIEDAASLQLALNKVLQALLDKLIDQKTATTLLYGLQIAFANIRKLKDEQVRDEIDRDSLARQEEREMREMEEEEEEDDEAEEAEGEEEQKQAEEEQERGEEKEQPADQDEITRSLHRPLRSPDPGHPGLRRANLPTAPEPPGLTSGLPLPAAGAHHKSPRAGFCQGCVAEWARPGPDTGA